MRIWPVVLTVLVVALAAGCTGRTSSGNRQVDPAVRVAAAVTGLERTELPVTREQAGRLLPLFRALRGTPVEDRPAVAALVKQVDVILTEDQRAALRRLREQRRPGGPGSPDAPGSGGSRPGVFGPGRPPGSEGRGGPGGSPPDVGGGGPPAGGLRPREGAPGAGQPSAERMAAFRGQILDRAIAVLEDRAQ
jgi:hypothetical protein